MIDPVAQRWYRDVDAKPLMWHDGIDLTTAVRRTTQKRLLKT